jgi:carboxyl-terminal processing protease
MMEPTPAFVADRSRSGVLVLTVEGFELGLGRWMGEQLQDLSPETDVVIDLRGNPGGRLAEADAVLSCFLPLDRPWAARTGRSGRRMELRTAGGCGALQVPVPNDVAVLVDGNSRSAAELTPAALQEARRAVVVGAPTAGAVLISQETRLPDGGRLSLSRADFVTSGGVRLEKRGVTPDVAAPVTPEDRLAGRDPGLDAALAALAEPRSQPAMALQAAPAL